MIDFPCPHCGQRMSVPDSLAGSVDTCAACKGAVRVPSGLEISVAELASRAQPAPPQAPYSWPRWAERGPAIGVLEFMAPASYVLAVLSFFGGLIAAGQDREGWEIIAAIGLGGALYWLVLGAALRGISEVAMFSWRTARALDRLAATLTPPPVPRRPAGSAPRRGQQRTKGRS